MKKLAIIATFMLLIAAQSASAYFFQPGFFLEDQTCADVYYHQDRYDFCVGITEGDYDYAQYCTSDLFQDCGPAYVPPPCEDVTTEQQQATECATSCLYSGDLEACIASCQEQGAYCRNGDIWDDLQCYNLSQNSTVEDRQDAGYICAMECSMQDPFDSSLDCFVACINGLDCTYRENQAEGPEVPEFGALGALAILATAGVYLYRRK